MAIGDHAISDRAISAPEDVVVVGVFAVGRVVVYDGPVGACGLSDSPANDVLVFDSGARGAVVGDLPARGVNVSDGATGAVVVGSFPP